MFDKSSQLYHTMPTQKSVPTNKIQNSRIMKNILIHLNDYSVKDLTRNFIELLSFVKDFEACFCKFLA